MSLDTKSLLDEIDKLFAKQNAKWDQWFAARDAKWDQRFSSRKSTLPVQISTEQPAPAPATSMSPPTALPDVAAAAASFVAPPEGAVVRLEVPLASRVVPTAAGMAEILDMEPTDEIRNGFVDIEPTDEVSYDGCLTPAVIAPTESVAVFPIDAGEQLVPYGPIDTKSVNTELVDRLSFLPDVLRGNIVSRLPVKDVVRTAVLSCRWRPVWRIAPPALVDVHILSPGFTPASPSKEDTTANISPARRSPTPPSTVDSFASSDWAIPEHRYISTHNHAYSIRVTGATIPVNCGYETFSELSAQLAKLPLPSLAVLVAIIPWPPPVHSEISDDNFRLRPVPWPSFWEYSLNVHWFILLLRVIFYSISQPIVKILIEDISRDCWQNRLELYEHAVQIDGINWKDSILSGFIVDQYVHSPIKGDHVSSITDCHYTRGAKLVTFSETHNALSLVQFLLSPELALLHNRNLVLELSLEHIFDSSSEWFWGTDSSALYETLVQVVGFNRKEAFAWVQLTYGSNFIVSEACMGNCRWLIAIFLLCPSCIVHYASCKHNKEDRDFVLWIPWKSPWLFSMSAHWVSYAIVAVTVITRTHMLFQFYPSRFGFVLQWPVVQPDACNINSSLLLSPSDVRCCDLLHKYFQINQSAASYVYSLSVAVTTSTADNMTLDPSKVAISRLTACSEFEIQVNGVQLRPIPWPSFVFHQCDLMLLLLLSWLPPSLESDQLGSDTLMCQACVMVLCNCKALA